MRSKFLTTDAVRNFVFGVEDSLVSTVGLISGVAAAGAEASIVVLTGCILIVVEAFSMAAGSLLSDNSADEFQRHTTVRLGRSLFGSIVMFISYIVSGIVVIAPYVVLNPGQAFAVSIGLSLVSLLILAVISARLSGTRILYKAVSMVLIGGMAIAIGVGVSSFVSGFIG